MSDFSEVDEIRKELEAERLKCAMLTSDLAIEKASRLNSDRLLCELRRRYGEANFLAEVEEEALVNKLMHKIEMVNHDKETLIKVLEQEEEFMTNTLQRQLTTVRAEKAAAEVEILELKRQMEQMKEEREALASLVKDEKQYLTNSLSIRLQAVVAEKETLERRLYKESTDNITDMNLSIMNSTNTDYDNNINNNNNDTNTSSCDKAHVVTET